ncbi:MAG TPA: hypothetical protein VN043_14065 [Rhodanobacter sp.]|nr:hypothetical protein [Rhodanobacter sp.]
MQMTLSTLGAGQVRSADGDESSANTAEGDLLAEECREEKHAASGDEEIAAALYILWIRHFTLLLKA